MIQLNKNIFKSALLGTNNVSFDTSLLPKEILEVLDTNQPEQKVLLDALTLYHRFMEAGSALPRVEGFNQKAICEVESVDYLPNEYQSFLSLLMVSDSSALEYYMPLLLQKATLRGEIFHHKEMLTLSQKIKNEWFYQEALLAFGHRGEWLLREQNVVDEELAFLDMNLAQRKAYFENVVEDTPKAIEFLNEIFDAESVVVKYSYVKTLNGNRTYPSLELLDLFDSKISTLKSNGKTVVAMKDNITLLRLQNPNSELFQVYFETIFTQIWNLSDKTLSSSQKLSLKPIDELEEILKVFKDMELENYYSFPYLLAGIDLAIYFIVSIVPLGMWSKHFDISIDKVIDAIGKIKPFVVTKQNKRQVEFLNYLDGVGERILGYRQKDEALILFEHSGLKHISNDILWLVEENERFEFINKHHKLFRDDNLIQYFGHEIDLDKKYTYEQTKMLMKSTLNKYVTDKLRNDLWRNAHYFDDNLIAIVKELYKKEVLGDNFYNTIYEIEQIKQQFKKL